MNALLLAALALTPAPLGGGTTERASVDGLAKQASGDSMRPALSADGRHVAFFSEAPDLVPGDTNGEWDVFVRDRLAGLTTRVSVGAGGLQADDTSFSTTHAGRGVSISPDGRFVAFHSSARNLVAVDTNYAYDCFVHDRDPDQNGVYDEGNGFTQLVSVDSNGLQYASEPSYNPWISADGRYVAFESNGRLHPGDSNVEMDVYVRDRKLGLTYLVSSTVMGGAGDGASYHPVISGSGMYVAYTSAATNLAGADLNGVPDVYVTAWTVGLTQRVSVGPGGLEADDSSGCAAIDDTGFHVAFQSDATNLHPDDQNGKRDVFVHDLTTGVTTPISRKPGGKTADDDSLHPMLSPNARYVAFESLATNMTPLESFHFRDVFVFDRLLGTMRWVSPADPSSDTWPHADGRSRWPSIGDSIQLVAFEGESRNLVPDDTNDAWDVFVRRSNRAWKAPWK